jgi:hypothetical protein
MKHFFTLLAGLALVASLSFASDTPVAAADKAPAAAEVTSIAKLNAEPATFADKDVVVAGKVLRVCQGAGCWVELEGADKGKIICKSMDETILFPKDCAGKMVEVQGKLIYDAKAKGEENVVSHKGAEAPHACPAPQAMVSIKSAKLEGVTVAAVAPEAPHAEPAVNAAPAAEEKAPVKAEVKPEEKKDAPTPTGK